MQMRSNLEALATRMTALYLKSCPRCAGDIQFIPGGGVDPYNRLECIQCGWTLHPEPTDAARLRALDPRYATLLDRRKAVVG